MVRRAAPQCQQIASDCVSAGCISTSMTQAWHHPQPTHKISLAMLGKCIIMCNSLLLEKQCSRRPETRSPKVTGGWDGMAATNSTPPSQGQGAPPALTLMPLPPHHLGSTCLQHLPPNLFGKCKFNTSRQKFGGYACDCDNAECLPSTFLAPSL